MRAWTPNGFFWSGNFCVLLGATLAVCVVLILYRLPQLRSENQIESFLSREAAFLFNNLILLGAAFAVMCAMALSGTGSEIIFS